MRREKKQLKSQPSPLVSLVVLAGAACWCCLLVLVLVAGCWLLVPVLVLVLVLVLLPPVPLLPLLFSFPFACCLFLIFYHLFI
jgi:hypothetical protein